MLCKTKWTFYLLLLVFQSSTFGQINNSITPVFVNDTASIFSLEKHLRSIPKLPKKIPNGKVSSNSTNYLTVQNVTSNDVSLMLYISNKEIDSVFLLNSSNGKVIVTGDLIPFEKRPVQLAPLFIPISFAPKEVKHFVIRLVNSSNREKTKIQLLSTATAFRMQADRAILIMLFVGILIAATIYNLFLFINLGNTVHLKYSLYILSCNLYMAYDEGLIFQYIIPDAPALNETFFFLFSFLSVASALSFIPAFIAQDKAQGWLEKTLMKIQWLTLASGIIIFVIQQIDYNFINENNLVNYLYLVISIASIALMIYVVVEIIKLNSNAIRYAAAASVLTYAVVYLILNYIGLIDDKQGRLSLLFLGLTIEIIVLTFYIAYQTNLIHKKQFKLENELAFQLSKQVGILEAERHRIARELHDGLGGLLGALRLMVNGKLFSYKKKNTEEEYIQTLEQIQVQLDKSIYQTRDIAFNMIPHGWEERGLQQNIIDLIEIMNDAKTVKLNFNFDKALDNMPATLQLAVYNISAELLNNSFKHANAKLVHLHLALKNEKELSIEFNDDGSGFNPNKTSTGMGLRNITMRVEELKGNMKINSTAGGTSFLITLPL